MNFWQEILTRPRDVYAKLSRGQRVGVLALASVAIVIAALASLLGGRQSYAHLYGNLDPNDANDIVAKLTELGIPYQLSRDGSLVEVPDENVNEARMQLASAGLPQIGAQGYTLFDGNQLGVTDQLFNVQSTRALQGEFENAISEFPAIQKARVLIYLSGQSVYSKDKARTTASVILWQRTGALLGDTQVAAIAHMLATGVGHGLQPEDVTITDSRANLLFPRSDGSNSMLSLAALQSAQAHNRELEEAAESQLNIAFGPGKATVRVSVELDTKYTEKATETVKDTNRVPIKSSTTRDGGSGGKTATNTKGKGDGVITEQQDEYREGVERALEIVAAGAVKRMSVSLIVDQSLFAPSADGKPSEVTAEKIEAVVKEAIGFVNDPKDNSPTARKDTFKMMTAPFVQPPAPEAAPGPFAIENLLPLAGNLAEALTVVIVLLTLTRVLRGGKAKPKGKSAGGSAPVGPTGIAGSPASRNITRNPESDEPIDELQELVLGESRGVDVRTRLARFVQHYPDQAREVLVAWLKEEVAA